MEQAVIDRERPIELDKAMPLVHESVSPAPQARTSVVRESPAVEQQTASAKAQATHSPEINEIASALATAQGEFDVVEKNKHAVGTKFTFEYEDLASVLRAVRPALSKNGIAMVQLPTTVQNGIVLETMLIHGRSGQFFRNRMALGCDPRDAQAVGSAITYARRYALKSMLGIASEVEDDDGVRAKQSTEERAEPPRAAQRVSQKKQQQSKQQPDREEAKMPPEAGDATIVLEVVDKDRGALIKLSSGITCASRDPEMIAAAKRLAESKAPIEAVVRPSSDPSRYAPMLEELIVVVAH